MRVTSVGQENNTKPTGVLKAATIGAVGGALVRKVAPLTTEEFKLYFNSSAQNAIKQKVSKVRANEIKIMSDEFNHGTLNVAKDAFDVFEAHSGDISKNPKVAHELLESMPDNIKAGFSALLSRVDKVGIAKQHVEVSNIKNAAKASRPLAFFAIAGALFAMSGQIMVNAFKSCLPEEENEGKHPEKLTMANVLLEGLGPNTEILYLTNKAIDNKA